MIGARGIAGLIALGALVLAPACRAPQVPAEPVDSSRAEIQGAVLIVLDTVRADHVSVYGHRRATSPALDRLAGDGVLFEQVVSFAPWTLPSAAAILSGKRAEAAYIRGRLRESVVERIRSAEFRTAAITEGGFFSSTFGFDLGFDEYQEEEGAVQLKPRGVQRDPTPAGGIETTFRNARRWVAAHRDERFLLMIQTYEPHTPYVRHAFTRGLDRGSIGDVLRINMLPALRTGRVRLNDSELDYIGALYDGGILESDRHVGSFLKFLESQGLRERLLVVVTSDHGEELGEHDRARAADHGHALFDDQLLVPLILHNPLEPYPRKRISTQVRTMDILPTIADILGVDPGQGLDGASLVPLMRGEESAERPAVGGSTKAGPPRAFLRYRGYKFVAVLDPRQGDDPLPADPPRFQLYDLRADPGEQINLAGERPELMGRFLEMFGACSAGTGTTTGLPDEMSGELRERLRSLGYLQ
jgi:hypothetical protein